MSSLLKNPEINGLLGGLQSSTLGDTEVRLRAKKTGRDVPKNVTERAGAPTFSTAIEIMERQRVRIYLNIAETVDAMLAHTPYLVEERWQVGEQLFSKRFFESPSSNHTSSVHWFDLLSQNTKKKSHNKS